LGTLAAPAHDASSIADADTVKQARRLDTRRSRRPLRPRELCQRRRAAYFGQLDPLASIGRHSPRLFAPRSAAPRSTSPRARQAKLAMPEAWSRLRGIGLGRPRRRAAVRRPSERRRARAFPCQAVATSSTWWESAVAQSNAVSSCPSIPTNPPPASHTRFIAIRRSRNAAAMSPPTARGRPGAYSSFGDGRAAGRLPASPRSVSSSSPSADVPWSASDSHSGINGRNGRCRRALRTRVRSATASHRASRPPT
jgi:hypothetical protein